VSTQSTPCAVQTDHKVGMDNVGYVIPSVVLDNFLYQYPHSLSALSVYASGWMPLRVAPLSQCTSLHVAIPHAAAQYAEAWIGLRRTSFDSV
jgi:hypothetical protein